MQIVESEEVEAFLAPRSARKTAFSSRVGVEHYFEDLRMRVRSEDNVMVVPMAELREGSGYGRLGPGVCAEISRLLSAVGLGHAPTPLPKAQGATVLVYRRGTEVAELVSAVLYPTDDGVSALRSATGTEESGSGVSS